MLSEYLNSDDEFNASILLLIDITLLATNMENNIITNKVGNIIKIFLYLISRNKIIRNIYMYTINENVKIAASNIIILWNWFKYLYDFFIFNILEIAKYIRGNKYIPNSEGSDASEVALNVPFEYETPIFSYPRKPKT